MHTKSENNDNTENKLPFGILRSILLFIGLTMILFSLKVLAKTELSGAKEIVNKVFEDLIIHGSFKGEDIRAHNVVVHGTASLVGMKKRTEVIDDILVYGSLLLDNVEVQGSVTVYGEVVVKDSYIVGDVITNSQDIKLKGDTTIGGKLDFSDKWGTVYLSEATSIIGGIQNGEIYQDIKITAPVIDGQLMQ